MIPARSQAPPPLILGRYRIVQQLARGGMGVVYLGRVEGTAGFAKPVVIKRMLVSFDDSQTEMAVRFVREAKILSNLTHPGIVGVVDFGQDEGGYAMVLDYVHGFDLGRWLNYTKKLGRTIDWEQAAVITLSVLDALHYAHTFKHSHGGGGEVIHRDISPGNILIDASGAVRLADFGVARMAGFADDHHTRAGVVPGKLSYMAPELLEGIGASPASDVYATALVLYQLLTGTNPFRGEGQVRTLALVALGQAPPVRNARPDVPAELSALLAQALARSPQERPRSAGVFAQGLRTLLRSDEAAIHANLRDLIQVDYEKLPGALGLTSLSEREQAWRTPGDATSRPQPRSDRSLSSRSAAPAESVATPTTMPLGARRRAQASVVKPGATVVPWDSAPSRLTTDAPAARGAHPPASPQISVLDPSSEEGLTLASIPIALDTPGEAEPGVRRSPLLWVAGVAGGGVLVALAVVASGALSRGPTTPAYLVLDRSPVTAASSPAVESSAGAQPEPASEPPLPAAAATTAATPLATPKSAPRRKAATPQKPASLNERLSRGFARRQTELTHCFKKNPSKVKDLSVSFTVDPKGSVIAARLRPTSVEPSPLGRCVLGVARSTRFEQPGRELQFTIPLMLTEATNP